MRCWPRRAKRRAQARSADTPAALFQGLGWGAIGSGALGGGAASAFSSNGDINAIAIGALTGAGFGAAGDVGAVSGANSFASYAAHASVGCVSAVAGGGNCGAGAASAVFGKYTTNALGGFGGPGVGGVIARGVATVVAGGVGSVIAGGKFENGATTAAFGYLFNAMSQAARARLIGVGAVAGGTLGAAGAGACTAGTGGVCALGAPTLVAGGAAIGAVVGDALATGIDRLTDKVNGNSWLSPDPTSVYVLNSNVDGSILKFGITNLVGNEMARYSAGEMAALNANMSVIATFDTRAPARMLEIGLCTGYVATNGKLPPASSKC